MAEMLSVASILLAVDMLARSSDPEYSQRSRDKQSILAAVFLSFSYFFKIQFIYIIVLIPSVLIIRWFTTHYIARNFIIRQGFIISGTLLLFLLIYLLGWYLPNRQTYDYIMANQSGELSLSGKTWEYVKFNLSYHFFHGWLQWFLYFFIVLLFTGFYFLDKSKSKRYPVLFLSSFMWFLLELHKLTMVYLPTRYQVSFLASMGLLMSLVLFEMLSIKKQRQLMIFKPLAIFSILVLLCINLFISNDSLHHRSYVIRDTNLYLSKYINKKDVVLGAWAPSLTWKSGSRALPVWNNFLNYQDPINKFNPSVIIAESDEQDSEQAWKSQGVDLSLISDSTKSVRIGNWDLVVYWLP